MNSDSFVVYRSDYATGHPFLTQTLALTTTAAQAFQITGPQNAIVAVPSQAAILGSQTMFDPNSNGAASGTPQAMGAYSNRSRPFFSSSSFDGRAFRVRAMGKYSNQGGTTNAQTVTFKIVQGTTAGGTAVATVSSGTNTVSGNFLIEATLNWDSVGQYVNGEQFGFVAAQTGSSYTTRAASTAVNVTAYTSLQFVCTCTVATTNSTSTAQLVEFSMEQV